MQADAIALFPGQGSQFVGMGAELLKEFPEARLAFEEAEDSVKLSLRKICLEGPEEQLGLTEFQQPCILTLSTAIWRVIKAESSFDPLYFAGHSLGEYSALVASEKLSLAKAASLVHKRGQAMQEAVQPGIGAMAAVIGFNELELIEICKKVSVENNSSVEVVNFNSPQQQIISGYKDSVEAVCKILLEKQIRCVQLPVSAPFHSSLMSPAKKAMTPFLETLSFPETKGQIIANLSGKIEKSYHSKLLLDQIDHPVLWTKTMETAKESSVSTLLEVGPGKVLFGLARRCLPRQGFKLMHSSDIKSTLTQLK